MYNFLAFIPKAQGDHNVASYLHEIGARNIIFEVDKNVFYNEFDGRVPDVKNVIGIVNYVNELGGVIKINGTYYQEFRLPSHLEIADEDGMLNPSDGVYSDEY